MKRVVLARWLGWKYRAPVTIKRHHNIRGERVPGWMVSFGIGFVEWFCWLETSRHNQACSPGLGPKTLRTGSARAALQSRASAPRSGRTEGDPR